MANDKRFVVKNGLQSQNIAFVDSDKSNTITANMLSSDTLSFEGQVGQLFSIADSMGGTIFSVNDISGIPSIEVDDDGEIRLAETFGHVLIGTDSSTDTSKHIVQITGGLNADSATIDGTITLSDDLVFGDRTTTDGHIQLYNGTATSGYTIGVEDNTLYSRSYQNHRWYINSYADGGTSDKMELTASQLTVAGDIQALGGNYFTDTSSQRVKYGTYSDQVSYGMGMESNITYGGLNNDWAITFQMNADNDRGFWFGDTGHNTAQGAMALTTEGKLTVAHSARVGYGETDTTTPGATHTLDVSGSFIADSVHVNSKSIIFEGNTEDAHETTIAVTEPTADRTITFPNITGDVPVKLYTDITTSGNSSTTLQVSNSTPSISVAAQTYIRWVFHDVTFSSGPNSPTLAIGHTSGTVSWTGSYNYPDQSDHGVGTTTDLLFGLAANHSPIDLVLNLWQTDTNDWVCFLHCNTNNSPYYFHGHATGVVPANIQLSSGGAFNVTGFTGSLTEEFGVIS